MEMPSRSLLSVGDELARNACTSDNTDGFGLPARSRAEATAHLMSDLTSHTMPYSNLSNRPGGNDPKVEADNTPESTTAVDDSIVVMTDAIDGRHSSLAGGADG